MKNPKYIDPQQRDTSMTPREVGADDIPSEIQQGYEEGSEPPDQRERGKSGIDREQRVQDWAEIFRVFQDHEQLRPHHNVEINGLLSQKEMQSEGELIFYFGTIGSMTLEYSDELYDHGILVRGTVEIDPSVKSLYTSEELTETVEWLTENIDDGNRYLQSSSHFSMDSESGTIYRLHIPYEYEDRWITQTIETSVQATEKLVKSIGPENLDIN